ncbi:MAG: N-acetylmuramoyl-L-alanine amidase, partial [Bdellovibrionales bacterium]|nr:N-acetylmuramoyl-L-alanine amidase [Bdellovibrionales bacterium]
MKFLLFLLLFSYSSLALKIMVDPGHGGSDRGAVYGQAEESKLVL